MLPYTVVLGMFGRGDLKVLYIE